MNNIWGHLRNILVHKWWVCYYCFKLRIPWQGITHDLSKLSWVEFSESIKFFQGDKSPIPVAKQTNGYSEAWQHHKGRNKHHYEYWIDNTDSELKLIPIPYKYVLELIADYLAAFRTYNGYINFEEEYKWWLNKVGELKFMNPATKEFITMLFRYMCYRDDNVGYINKDDYWKNVYIKLINEWGRS